MNPFEEFFPIEYETGTYVGVRQSYRPDVRLGIPNDGFGRTASIDGIVQTLYDARDLLNWTSEINQGTKRNLQGLVGERMLSLVMDAFLLMIAKTNPEYTGKVIKETERDKGKGITADFNDRFILKFKGRSNFVILEKDLAVKPVQRYKQERFGILSAELDGLGYLHTPDQAYLLIGESSTKQHFMLNAWDEKGRADVQHRVFRPLKSLFYDHHLIYFVTAPYKSLWDESITPSKLRVGPVKVYKELKSQGIDVIFIPFPRTDPSFQEIADEMVEKIPLVRATLQSVKDKYA